MTKKRFTLKSKVHIYESFLINLHTARWTGDQVLFGILMDKLAAYSYSRTNSNGHYKEEERRMKQTLLNLGEWHDEYKVKKTAEIERLKKEHEERMANDPAYAALAKQAKDIKDERKIG